MWGQMKAQVDIGEAVQSKCEPSNWSALDVGPTPKREHSDRQNVVSRNQSPHGSL